MARGLAQRGDQIVRHRHEVRTKSGLRRLDHAQAHAGQPAFHGQLLQALPVCGRKDPSKGRNVIHPFQPDLRTHRQGCRPVHAGVDEGVGRPEAKGVGAQARQGDGLGHQLVKREALAEQGGIDNSAVKIDLDP